VWGREEFRFLERLDVREVHVAVRVAEAPHRRIVCVRRQLRCGVGAEGEPVAAGAKLRVEGVVGARPDTSKTGRSTAGSWGEGEVGGAGTWRRRSGRYWRVEKKKRRGAGGKFLMVGVRTLCHLYSARASRRCNFCARDSVIARTGRFFSHAGLAPPPLEERGRVHTHYLAVKV
jgi:hypothetical protein